MKSLLSRFNLGDAYEIEARVLPAMLVVVPVAILVAQVAFMKKNWLGMIGWGVGLEVVLAILVSKVGHALGTRLQGKLEKEWGGLPTHVWLRPSDHTHSEQQKGVWRNSLSNYSGLNIEKEIEKGDSSELDRVIADAVMASRNRMRGHAKASLLQTYNIAFGFARNLAGLRWFALILCCICTSISIFGVVYSGFEMAGLVIQILFLTIAGMYSWLALGYVKHCAVRYAEYFYAALTAISNQTEKRA